MITWWDTVVDAVLGTALLVWIILLPRIIVRYIPIKEGNLGGEDKADAGKRSL